MRPLVVGCGIAVLVAAAPARAQQDWSLTRPDRPRSRPAGKAPREPAPSPAPAQRGDREQVLIQRYLRVLASDPSQTFARQRLFELYRARDGSLEGLRERLRGELQAEPEDYARVMLLAEVQRAAGDAEAAVRTLERARELRPRAPLPLEALARVHRDQGRAEQATGLLRQALELTQRAAARLELLRDLAELALERGDYDAAERWYARLREQSPGGVYQAAEYARALERRGQHERAAREYRRVLASLRGDNRVRPPLLVELAKAELEAGDAGEAIATLRRARRLTGARSGVRREIDETLVQAHRRAGRLPELVERLRARRSPSASEREMLGRIYDELGDHERALEAYRATLRRSPRDVDVRVRVIRLLSRQGRLDEVMDEYRVLIRHAPGEPRFVVELAQLMMERGRRDEALAMLAKTGRRFARDAQLHRALVALYTRWGEEELARKELALLARIEPEEPAHLMALGEQLLAQGDDDGALEVWRRILRTMPDKAAAHATLGGLYRDHDMLSEALAEYQKAVKLRPGEMRYVRGLAETLEQLGRHREAVERWQRVLALSGDDRLARREARRRIVGILARAGRLKHRIKEYRRRFGWPQPAGSSSAEPDLEAGRFLAEAYLKLARQRNRMAPSHQLKAERVLQRIIRLDPGDIESMLALERSRTARGDIEGALEVLEKLVEADPRRAQTYLARMAKHALSLYRDDEAVSYAERAVRLNPDDATAHRRLGDLYRARQDHERAIESYRRAIELDERLYGTYFTLAELHLVRAQPRQADRLYREVMRSSPDDELVARAVHASLQLNLGRESLESLERELLPLALAHPGRPVYRRLVVELYGVLAGPLVQQIRMDTEQAGEARQQLQDIGKRALKPLLEALADRDPTQRRIAIDVLADLGNSHAAAPLLSAAESDGDMTLRRRALIAAGTLATPAMAGRFARLARGSQHRLRDVAAWALARLGKTDVLRGLLKAGEPAVRVYAALGLGAARDEVSVQSLVTMVRHDRSSEVRAAAALAVANVGHADALDVLAQQLPRERGDTARAMVTALGRTGDARAAPALGEALFSADARLQRAALEALSSLARTVVPFEPDDLPAPSHGEPVSRFVTRLQPEHGASAVAGALQRFRPSVVRSARAALRGPVEVVLAVLAVLGPGGWTDPDASDDRAAGEAYAAVRGGILDELLPDLVALVQHPDALVRARAARIWVQMDDDRAAAAVVDALTDPSLEVQRSVLEAMTAAPRLPARLAPRLAQLLDEHPSWSLRLRAAKALGKLGGSDALGALARAVRTDAYAYVREAAALSLGRIGGPRAVAPLSEALEHDRERAVRAAARRSLERMGTEGATRALER